MAGKRVKKIVKVPPTQRITAYFQAVKDVKPDIEAKGGMRTAGAIGGDEVVRTENKIKVDADRVDPPVQAPVSGALTQLTPSNTIVLRYADAVNSTVAR